MSGPIVDPHGTLLRDTNIWHRHAGAARRPAGTATRGVGRRGVALVGVDLDRRAVVDDRGVVGVVALGVVRVDGVGVVGRDAARRGEEAVEVVARRRRRRAAARAPSPRNGPDAPVVAGRADLLVVEQGDHRDVVGSARRRRSAVVAAQHDTWLSSRPLASSERSAPSTARRLHVEQAQLPRTPARRRRPRSASHSSNVGVGLGRPHRASGGPGGRARGRAR